MGEKSGWNLKVDIEVLHSTSPFQLLRKSNNFLNKLKNY